MPYIKPQSSNHLDYEINIRKRGENDYASYCPQLNKMFRGEAHEGVQKMMQDFIDSYIEELKNTPPDSDDAVL